MMTIWALAATGGCAASESGQQLLYRMAGKRPRRWYAFVAPAAALYVVTWFLWAAVLKAVPLGEALPLMGFAYVLTALACPCLFGERVDLRRWVGIVFVIAGVTLVSRYGE